MVSQGLASPPAASVSSIYVASKMLVTSCEESFREPILRETEARFLHSMYIDASALP